MMTFDSFQPGTVLGDHDFSFTDETMDEWFTLFPDDRESLPTMPAAMIAVVVMRAFMSILDDRPRGNVHASQKFWVSRLPQIDDRLSTRLTCIGKELKNNRRWVTFGTDTTGVAEAQLFHGQMKMIWAA